MKLFPNSLHPKTNSLIHIRRSDLNTRMFVFENPENFIGEGLTYCGNFFNCKLDCKQSFFYCKQHFWPYSSIYCSEELIEQNDKPHSIPIIPILSLQQPIAVSNHRLSHKLSHPRIVFVVVSAEAVIIHARHFYSPNAHSYEEKRAY